MLMGKDEIKNTLVLTKFKFKHLSSNLLMMFFILLFIFIASIFSTILRSFKYKTLAEDFILGDHTFLIFFCLIILFISLCTFYRRRNSCYKVFPQTNTSRFLSTQLSIYLLTVVMSLFSLALYLIKFMVFKLIASFKNNIVIAFSFDLGFVINGFFVYLLYALLASTFISFIALLIRKYNAIAVVALLSVFAFLISGNLPLIQTITNRLSFLIKEGSISVFFIKGIVVWLILLTACIIINKYTSYYKTQKVYSNAIVAVVGFILIMTISVIRVNLAPDESFNTVDNIIFDDKSPWINRSMTLDASDIADPSRITVTSNFDRTTDNLHLDNNIIYRSDSVGDKIIIYYRFPVDITNDYNITDHMNPKLDASYKDNVLNITYTYDKNIKIIFISPWSMMKQFDKYKGKNLYFDVPILYTSNSNGDGQVSVELE